MKKKFPTAIDSFRKYRHDEEFQRLYREQKALLDVAIALAEAREKQGLTQAALAKKIGMKQSQIARIENGRENVTITTLTKITTALKKQLVLR